MPSFLGICQIAGAQRTRDGAWKGTHSRLRPGLWLMLVGVTLFVTSCGDSANSQSGKRHTFREVDYQRVWAKENGGRMEVRLDDGTRVDIKTKTHALEVDFAENWAESIGQSLHYASKTKLRAGIVLIVKGQADQRCMDRLKEVIKDYNLPIDVYPMDADLNKARRK